MHQLHQLHFVKLELHLSCNWLHFRLDWFVMNRQSSGGLGMSGDYFCRSWACGDYLGVLVNDLVMVWSLFLAFVMP